MDIKPNKKRHPFKILTREIIDKVVKEIAAGSTHKYGAQSNGVAENLFNYWRQQGEVDLMHEQDENKRTLPAQLVVELAKVKSNEIKECRENIRSSSKGHDGAQWTLEKAYTREFGNSAAIKAMSDQLSNDDVDKLKLELKEESHGL